MGASIYLMKKNIREDMFSSQLQAKYIIYNKEIDI